MKTNRSRTLSILMAIATSAFALSGCADQDAELDDVMEESTGTNEARPDESSDLAETHAEKATDSDEENVAETEQALYQYVTLGHMQSFISPTMAFWVNTRIDIYNDSNTSATVSLQAGAVAPEYIFVAPRGVRTIYRQYWGLGVNITNVSSTVLRVKVTG